MKKFIHHACLSFAKIRLSFAKKGAVLLISLIWLRSTIKMMLMKNNHQASGQSRFIFSVPLLVLVFALFILPGCEKLDDFLDHKHQKKGVDLQLVADGFTSPIGVVAVPDDSDKLYVIDQIGKIWILDATGSRLPEPFLDLSSALVMLNPNGDERGLLGLAFHPDYKQNGRFFIYYQLPPRAGGPPPQPGPSWNNLSRLSEFRVSAADPNKADMSSEKIILEWDDPQGNHNGGTVAFGPDRYLYISIGDGGAANDVAPGHVEDWYDVNAGGNGQDIETEGNYFGNILRLDIDNGSPYGIPADNPFVDKPGLDEIYAYGFRNPYRFSFDMGGSHHLLVGDAGQALYEEVSLVRKGGNYGWNVKEGTSCFNAASNLEELASCPDVDVYGNPLVDPVIEVNHFRNPKGGKASTVIGGHVYRGRSLPALYGKYIFGTFSQGRPQGVANAELFMANPRSSGLWAYEEVPLRSYTDDLGHFLKGFGQDKKGELYLMLTEVAGPTGTTGKVFKLVPVKVK
jgi:glucose/arabinose dehydrogenase